VLPLMSTDRDLLGLQKRGCWTGVLPPSLSLCFALIDEVVACMCRDDPMPMHRPCCSWRRHWLTSLPAVCKNKEESRYIRA
jgi:hypothetical protein